MTIPGQQAIPRRPEGAPLRASFAQERMWFLEQFVPDSTLSNQLNGVRLRGPLQVAPLEEALHALVRRHEALRTNLEMCDGQLLQRIRPAPAVELPVVDLSNRPSGEAEAEAEAFAAAEAGGPFDLASDPLLRTTLLRLSPEDHLLTLVTHHAIFDGWSVGVAIRELGALYQAITRGQPPSLADLPIRYADYAHWQRQRFECGGFDAQLRYWRQRLSGKLPILQLPADRPRPPVMRFDGMARCTVLPQRLAEALRAIGRRQGATLFMTLLGAFNVLLFRYTGQEDVIVGCPVAGRSRLETENLIGLFINHLALRTDLSGDPTFSELLKQIRRHALQAYDNQELPFDKLLEELNPERDPTRTPVFQAAFQLRNYPLAPVESPGLTLDRHEFQWARAQGDLTIELTETAAGLSSRLAYPVALFDDSTIERMAGHWRTLLEGIAVDPDQRICALPLLTPEERHQIVVEWNQTRTDYPRETSVHRLFEQQARKSPDAVAVTHGQESLTYEELNGRANQLARHLQSLGVEPGEPVGVSMERRLDDVISLLAILKAGCAYAPFDPTDPAERVAFMLGDSNARVVLTQQQYVQRMSHQGIPIVCVDSEWDAITQQGRENLPLDGTPDSLAYVMYTSGSTGRPKGVRVPHRGIVRLALHTNYIQIGPSDSVAHVANPAFDGATFEIWAPLLNGGRVVIFDTECLLSAARVAEEIAQRRLTSLFLTPAVFNLHVRDDPALFGSLRDLLVGGERVDPAPVREVLEHGPPERLINVYGPTENTAFSTWYLIERVPEDATSIPIGRPIANSEAYLLDPNRQPVPVGVVGEIYVGGEGLAEGYHNRPELTQEAFIPHPFRPQAGARLYKTGDLGRYLPDGSIDFLGRVDHQVKIRGYRVEPGEIEATLTQHPSVQAAVVVVDLDPTGERRLVAYATPAQGGVADPAELRQFLSGRLPEHMTPAIVVVLDAFPLTPNGKIDRQALPPPTEVRAEESSRRVAPRNALEETLLAVWEAVLGVHPIGVTDNFFDLGGHSLLAVRLLADVERVSGARLPLATLIQAPTVEQLAEVLLNRSWWPHRQSLVPLRPAGTRPPLFCMHPIGGEVLRYAELVRHLDPDRPVYGLQARGLDGIQEPFDSVEAMAAHYIAQMQTVQPRGPYYLLGYSSGGVTAFEAAQQLTASGQEVGLLAILDNPAPDSRYLGFPQLWRPRLAAGFLVQSSDRLARFARKDAKARWESLRRALNGLTRLARDAPAHLRIAASRAPGPLRAPHPWIATLSPVHKRTARAQWEALQRYRPQRYTGRITLFTVRERPLFVSHDPRMGWGEYAVGGVEVVHLPGGHDQILSEPNVRVVAGELEARLARADRAAAGAQGGAARSCET